MRKTIVFVFEVAIVLLCIGVIYSITNGFSVFQTKDLADNAGEMMNKFFGCFK